jgi:hypothetical protein
MQKTRQIDGKTEKTTLVVFTIEFSQSSVFSSQKQKPLYTIHFYQNQHTFSLIKFYLKWILAYLHIYVTPEAKIRYPNPYPYLVSSLVRLGRNLVLQESE